MKTSQRTVRPRARASPAGIALSLTLAVLLAPAPARGDEPGSPAGAEPPADEEIVVTATRSPRARRDVPVAVTVIGRAELERSAAKTADELLVGVPAFATFRRSSSMAADPTSQGVNIRGVGLSGISRALVLVDGVPSNDAFAGWVNWRSIPAIGVQRVEVAPGGGSALYGNYALGGVTQIISRPITPLAVEAETEAGSFGTGRVAARLSERVGPFGAALDGELLTSDGYPVVATWSRGPVDGATPSRHAAVNGRAEAELAPNLSVGARGSWFWEDFDGGTRYTTATVRRFDWAGSARYRPGSGVVDLAVFGHVSGFGQERARFNAAGPRRSSEELNAVQSVPSHDLGGSLLYASAPLSLAGTHSLSAGTDLRRITGDTHEDLFPPGTTPTAVVLRDGGGAQRLYGVFAQDVYDVTPALQASLAVRYDRFETVNGHTFEQARDGTTTSTVHPTRTGEELDPKLGLRARVAGWLTLRGGAYRAFRAPTLDELFRPFQVGPVRTDANPTLRPETLRGGELGFDLLPGASLTARATGFWNELADPVVNVDVAANRRQRQNLGRARIRGVETDVSWRFAPRWLAAAAYTFMDPTVTRAPGQEALYLGKQLPQVPKHRASLSVSYDDARLLTGNVQLRYLGSQYEDAGNGLPMGEALLVDVFAAWHFTQSVDLFFAVQNLFDETYIVGRAGNLDTVGQPRFLHAGVRVRTGG